MARTSKAKRIDARGYGARVRINSIVSEVKAHHRATVDATWDEVVRAANDAGQSAEAFGQNMISSLGRVKTGTLKRELKVEVPKRARMGRFTVKIGWPDWSKPIEYYDFQERGTYASRVGGYGGASMINRRVGGAGKRRGKTRDTSRNGIEPMLVIPATVEVFNKEFRRGVRK